MKRFFFVIPFFIHSINAELPVNKPAISEQLIEAVYANDLQLARTLIEGGADVNACRKEIKISHREHVYKLCCYESTEGEPAGWTVKGNILNATCLLIAIKNNAKEMVDLLLAHNADFNAVITYNVEFTYFTVYEDKVFDCRREKITEEKRHRNCNCSVIEFVLKHAAHVGIYIAYNMEEYLKKMLVS